MKIQIQEGYRIVDNSEFMGVEAPFPGMRMSVDNILGVYAQYGYLVTPNYLVKIDSEDDVIIYKRYIVDDTRPWRHSDDVYINRENSVEVATCMGNSIYIRVDSNNSAKTVENSIRVQQARIQDDPLKVIADAKKTIAEEREWLNHKSPYSTAPSSGPRLQWIDFSDGSTAQTIPADVGWSTEGSHLGSIFAPPPTNTD